MERRAQEAAANAEQRRAQIEKGDEKAKMKGKNRPSRKAARKKAALRKNIIDEKLLAKREKAQAKKEAKAQPAEPDLTGIPRALHRFYKKSGTGV